MVPARLRRSSSIATVVKRTIAAALTVLGVALPSAAQEPPEAEFVRVAAISPYTDAGTPLELTLQITNPTEVALEGVDVRVAVYGKLISRSQLRLALDRSPPTELIAATTEAVPDPIGPGEQRTVTIERPMSSLSVFRTGVYPVEISVSHAGGTTALRSAIPYVGTPPRAPLNVSVVLTVAGPTARGPDGAYDPEAIGALRLDETAQQMRAVAARARARVTLAPSASFVDMVADLADGFALRSPAGVSVQGESSPVARAAAALLDGLRLAAAGAADIATVPYVPADLPALVVHGPRGDVLRQITLARTIVAERLGRAPDPALLVPPGARLDQASAAAMGSIGVERALVDLALLPEPPAEPAFLRPDLFGPSRPVAFRTRAGVLAAAFPDPDLRARIAGDEQGPLLAQAIVAESASAWLELPDFGSQRLLVIAPERPPAPTAIAAALDGLLASPWVRLRPLGAAMRALPSLDAPLTLPREEPADTAWIAAARNARRSLAALAQIAVTPLTELEELDRQVLRAESAEWAADPQAGVALAAGATTHVARVFGAIRVARRSVTLTSRTGDVPVTVLNGNPFPVRVRIRLDSARVGFPQGSSRIEEIETPDATFDFRIETRATGSFPLAVRVETPDGDTPIAVGTLTLRSTAVSAVALTATGGGALFLLFAWFRRSRRRGAPRRG